MFKDMLDKRNIENVTCTSMAVSEEEIGNDIYPPAKRCLEKHNIPFKRHYAREITIDDYLDSDMIICMDESNLRRLRRIVGDHDDNKVSLLMDFASKSKEIEDPWYTGNFEKVFEEISEGLEGLLNKIMEA
ncbi:MAG: low molecular weight phosphotyrosine protein phosphatase [Clostridia bacterium]|nr:low molecular weight phosphotyrosine protein phosphatase [Clostridia bacterium]